MDSVALQLTAKPGEQVSICPVHVLFRSCQKRGARGGSRLFVKGGGGGGGGVELVCISILHFFGKNKQSMNVYCKSQSAFLNSRAEGGGCSNPPLICHCMGAYGCYVKVETKIARKVIA